MSFVTSATWCSDANEARKLVSPSARSIVSILLTPHSHSDDKDHHRRLDTGTRRYLGNARVGLDVYVRPGSRANSISICLRHRIACKSTPRGGPYRDGPRRCLESDP